MKPLSTAIFFQSDAYSISSEKLMGRNAAGASFLRGFLRHSDCDSLCALVATVEEADTFAATAKDLNIDKPVKYITTEHYGAMNNLDILYYPGPDIGELAFLRSTINPVGWSICGITHTTSSPRAMDSIAQWLTAPLQPWDAVICTSTSVKKHVEKILQAELVRLKERLGITRAIMPQLPVIPLGIHTEDFQFSPAERSNARKTLGIDEETLVVLYVGRLSFHAKAHPMAMYQAVELAVKKTSKKVVLVEAGWYANEYAKRAFHDAQALCCPSVKVIHLDGRVAENRKTAWASADIFCSLSDNVQETFGITPIEAMAAGLPLVVSDWDGYKDSVNDEVGFRIPTTMPQPGLGGDLAFRQASGADNYDFYCGHVCSFVAVDVRRCSDAFERLFDDPLLRQRLGSAGIARAKQHYDWSIVIPKYEALWYSLNESRVRQGAMPAECWPARMDPFVSFEHYPTNKLTPESMICRSSGSIDEALSILRDLYELEMIKFAKRILPTHDLLQDLLGQIGSDPVRAEEIVRPHECSDGGLKLRALAVLLKMGLITLVDKINDSSTQPVG